MIVSEQYQERFQKILNAVQLNPNNFNMSSWFNACPMEDWQDTLKDLLPQDEPSCGTTLCIAGWAAHNAGYRISQDGITAFDVSGCGIPIPTVARHYLGLDGDESTWLFHLVHDRALEALNELAKGGIITYEWKRGFKVEMPGDTNG